MARGWGIGGALGALVGVVGTAAVVVTNLTTIIDFIQRFFPEYGPIPIISVQNPRVIGDPQRVDPDANPAEVEIQVEYIERITAGRTLKACYSDIIVGNGTYQSPPTDRPADSQNLLVEKFVIPEEQYGDNATFRRVCTQRVADPVDFPLREIPAVIPPPPPPPPPPPQAQSTITSYVICVGQYERACRGAAIWLPCGTHPEKWAKSTHPQECKTAKMTVLSDVSGNRCGYATYQIACTN